MEKEFLSPIPVETIPGVGKVTLKELNSKGIYTIGDITRLPQDYFAAASGKYGIDLWRKAHGEGSEYLTVEREQKSISKETTFNKDVLSDEVIENTLFDLTGKVCQSMRDFNWQASTITVKLRYSDFQTLTRSKTIKRPSDDDKIIFETAKHILAKANTRRVAVRLIGVGLTKFNEACEQGILFEDEETKRKRLFKAVNALRGKYNYDIIKVGNKSI